MRLAQILPLTIVAFTLAAGQTRGQSQDAAAHWPQWRGPLGTGAAVEGNPPLRWSETTNVLWKVPLPGEGTSTPVIWGDKVFVQAAVASRQAGQPRAATPPAASAKGQGSKGGGRRGSFGGAPPPTEPHKFILMCLDRKTGKTLWEQVAREEVPHEGFRIGDGSFASGSAITDGEHVIAFFGSRGLYCYDMNGKLQWEKDLGDMQTRNDFGEGATPALHGDTIVVTWDHEEDDFIVAIDKNTGRELWRQPRDEPTTWATPLVVEYGGSAQVVTPGTNRVRSYDLKTGRLIWESEGLTLNAIPSPVMADGVVYVTAGFRGSKLLAVRLGATGDVTDTDAILWQLDRNTPYVPSPLLSENRLYFFSGNNDILSCYDIKTGEPYYGDRGQRVGIGTVYASPVAAGGKVYLVGRNGTTVVIKDGEEYEELAKNVLDEPIDASPAVVENQLFLRSRQSLYCLQEK